jgi:DeoR/GlpR family transcriptional regulator of sugar metabolism
LSEDRNLTIPDLASLIGVTERSIERNIRKLQEQGRLRRIGPAKGGHWEVQ